MRGNQQPQSPFAPFCGKLKSNDGATDCFRLRKLSWVMKIRINDHDPSRSIMVTLMKKPSRAENEIGHIAKFAICHAVLLEWFEEQKLLHPDARDLAIACTLAAGFVVHRRNDVRYTYRIHCSMVQSWNGVYPDDRVETMPLGIFARLIESLRENAGFRQNDGKVLLMRELGEVGEHRLHLFNLGFRDPQLSAIMCERFPHLTI
jgi:hypothetical protein